MPHASEFDVGVLPSAKPNVVVLIAAPESYPA